MGYALVRRAPRRLFSALLAACFALTGAPARAQASDPGRTQLSDEAELTRAVALYDAGKYEECAGAFGELLNSSGPRPLKEATVIERARIYHAACLIGATKPEQADAPLRDAIRANPQMRPPDTLVFPAAVVERFLRVRDTLRADIERSNARRLQEIERERGIERQRVAAERERLRELERLAAQETVVEKKERWIASVPFGVGQFHNGNEGLGYTFLITEALLTATMFGGIAVELQNYSIQDDPELDPNDIRRNASVARTVWVTSMYALIATAAAGMLEANLAFEPETRSVRPRVLPESVRPSDSSSTLQSGSQGVPRRSPASSLQPSSPSAGVTKRSMWLEPSAAAVPGGFSFGLGGRF